MGVYLNAEQIVTIIVGFPHTRGGVPDIVILDSDQLEFSPHAWGCTVHIIGTLFNVVRFPHTRGGVPPQSLCLIAS